MNGRTFQLRVSLHRTVIGIVTCVLLLNAMPSPANAGGQVLPGDLIKGSGSAVYYYFGNRYAFPNEDVYFSWYDDFSGVVRVSDEFIASMPLAGNIRFRPAEQMVKLTTDPKVYFVGKDHTLRWVPTEADAVALFGNNWSSNVRDLNDAFLVDYEISEPLTEAELARFSSLSPGEEEVRALRRRQLVDLLYEYEEPINVVTDTRGQRYPSRNLLEEEGLVESEIRLSEYGVTGTSTRAVTELKSIIETLSSDWTKQFDEEAVYLGEVYGYYLNYSQLRGETFAHRSAYSADTNPSDQTQETGVSVYEIEFPKDYLAYPRAFTFTYLADPIFLAHSVMTYDAPDTVLEWLKQAAPNKGWKFILAREHPTRMDLGEPVLEWIFRGDTSHSILRILYYGDPGGANGGAGGMQIIRIKP